MIHLAHDKVDGLVLLSAWRAGPSSGYLFGGFMVNRYSVGVDGIDPNGNLVRYKDYAELEQRIAELEKQRDVQKESADIYEKAYALECEAKSDLQQFYDDELCKLLSGVQYMDPPDGGSPTPLVQIARMVKHWLLRMRS